MLSGTKTSFPQNSRLIARLDIKSGHLIKGVHLEGLRKLGDPSEFALSYSGQGVDELLYIDAVASLYGRNHLSQLIEKVAEEVFIPITVGGGIRSIDDAKSVFASGADKVALNTAAIKNPKILSEIAENFGSQAVVLSIEAKSVSANRWEAYIDNGREKTGIDLLEWVEKGIEYGAGEILLTSVDREGTRKGMDLNLLARVGELSTVPVIASGGIGNQQHIQSCLSTDGIDAVALASVLHYEDLSLKGVRNELLQAGFSVRKFEE